MSSSVARSLIQASDLPAGDLTQLVAQLDAERQRLQEENAQLRLELKERYGFSNLVGTSGPMRQVHEQVSQVARANTTVLLRGESGTGKELAARAIRTRCPAGGGAFVPVNCGGLPTELVGPARCSVTARARSRAPSPTRRGLVTAASGGTLFLDEIGELQPGDAGQVAARAPGAGGRSRVGGTEPRRRSTCASSLPPTRTCEQAIAPGTFREDLYLSAQRLRHLHAAAARAEVGHHAARRPLPGAVRVASTGKQVRRISTPAIDMLASYQLAG